MLWIVAGATEHQVAEAIKTHWPAAEVKPLIVAAIEQLRQSGQLDVKVVRGWCFEAQRDLYRRMLEIGDFAGALRAVKQIHDMTNPGR